jgi:tetratricopeptide (TPR) repeat protein
MSKNAELSRKDMKEPDQFQVAAGEAASWLTGHRRLSVLVGGGAAVILVVALVVSGLRERSAAAAGGALSAVYRAAGGELTPVPLPGAAGPFFATDAERQKAVLDASARALAAGSGRPAALASLAKGDAHLKLGEWDAAAAAYQAYLAAAPRDDSFRFGALEGLALVEEAKGNADAALAAYARLATEVPAQADRADLSKARLLIAAGKKDEARQLLGGFAEAHKNSALASEASERLARLGGK